MCAAPEISACLTRREFLRSAGGITFLSLTPIGRGLFAAPALPPLTIPTFTALPYVQPGAETVRIAWQTLQRAAEFEVRFGRDTSYDQTAAVTRSSRDYIGKGDKESRYNYVCACAGLALGAEYRYRVRCNGETIAEGYFTTRQPRGRKIRFVAFGDNSFGDISDRTIAYQAYRANPDFIMNTGDNVYQAGLDTEYSRYFFPVYNADVAGQRLGAPLLRSVPFHTVLANHDAHDSDSRTKTPCADFALNADALAYYTNFHFPLNGPAPAHPTPLLGPEPRLDNFKNCAAARYPAMANYSYDAGDAHFLCLDSNLYIDPTADALQRWIDADLAATDARWKFAVFHHPPFNVGREHWHEQHMRALAPLFERRGVNIVLSGHEHNYQRTQPLRFTPRDLAPARALQSRERVLPGDFVIDAKFDGAKVSKADGVIYLTTGAGGNYLHDREFNDEPAKWSLPGDDHVRYVTKMISDRHSLSVFDVERDELLMRQIDEQGNEIDRIRLT